MGARGGAQAVAEQLAFLTHKGARALGGLVRQLEQRGLDAEDLLRLRAFVTTGPRAAMFLGELEQLLPRERWPALTVVQVPTEGRIATADDVEALDAIAAPGAGERRIVGDGAVRFGDWVFVGATLATSTSSERIAPQRTAGEGAARTTREGAAGDRIEGQAQLVFDRLQAALSAAQAQLSDVVKVGGWLTFPMASYGPLARVRSGLVQRGLLPASAAVQVSAVHPDKPLLAFEAVAFTAPATRVGGRVSPLAPYYLTASSAGGRVFTCGEIPRRPGPIGAQLRDVYEQLEGHLREHGATLADARAQTLYVRAGHDLQALAHQARELLAADPCTTVLPVTDMGFRPGVDVEVELVANTQL